MVPVRTKQGQVGGGGSPISAAVGSWLGGLYRTFKGGDVPEGAPLTMFMDGYGADGVDVENTRHIFGTYKLAAGGGRFNFSKGEAMGSTRVHDIRQGGHGEPGLGFESPNIRDREGV